MLHPINGNLRLLKAVDFVDVDVGVFIVVVVAVAVVNVVVVALLVLTGIISFRSGQ